MILQLRNTAKKLLLPHNRLGDKAHAVLHFHARHGYWPKLRKPLTFNENLLYIKLNCLDSAHRRELTDKYSFKCYVATRLGPTYVPKTFGLLDTPDSLKSFNFPENCVVKPTHACGRVFIRKCASEQVPIHEIQTWFDFDYYYTRRERNYKGLRRQILIEELLAFDGQASNDYKFFCFFGTPKMIQVDSNRFSGHKQAYYTPEWQRLPFVQAEYTAAEPQLPPANLGRMLDVAAQLSKDISPVRIDMYSDGKRIALGEMTHCHRNTDCIFDNAKADQVLGQLFTSPEYEPHELLNEL